MSKVGEMNKVVLIPAVLFQLVGLIVMAGGFSLLAFSKEPLTRAFMVPEFQVVEGLLIFLLASFFVAREWGKKRGLSPKCSNQAQKPAALALVVLFCLFVGWGFASLHLTWNAFVPEKPISIREGNLKAYSAIKRISKAQKTYVQTDWDGDGVNNYAYFVSHLWQTVTPEMEVVKVGLLPEELAQARVDEFIWNGFIFHNIYLRQATKPEQYDTDAQTEPLDYSKEWAAVAEPLMGGSPDEGSRQLLFLTDTSGKIYAKPGIAVDLQVLPFGYTESWTEISSEADVLELARTPEE